MEQHVDQVAVDFKPIRTGCGFASLSEGMIYARDLKTTERWLVLRVNDCRAVVTDLAKHDPLDPSVVVHEKDAYAVGFSCNAEGLCMGYFKGRIQLRESTKAEMKRPTEEFSYLPAPGTSPPTKRARKSKEPVKTTTLPD